MTFVHIPPVFTHLLAIPFWLAFFWSFGGERAVIKKARTEASDAQDEGTMQLILVGNSVAMLAASVSAFAPWFVIPKARICLLVGAGLMVAGGILRRICFRTLGEYFSGVVQARADQPVIDFGPYRWIRHPSYTAGFLLFLGFGFGLASWLSVAILLLVNVYVYSRRVAVEERVLVDTIGEPYREYMRRTKRFIPGLV